MKRYKSIRERNTSSRELKEYRLENSYDLKKYPEARPSVQKVIDSTMTNITKESFRLPPNVSSNPEKWLLEEVIYQLNELV